MGRRKISSIFSCFTPSASIPKTLHPSATSAAPYTNQISGAVDAVDTPSIAPLDAVDTLSIAPLDAVDAVDTPSIAPLDVPSSSTSAGPSSSVLKEQDHTKQISEAADAVDPGNVNADLNDLGNYISQYLAFIKHGGEKPSQAKCDWLSSESLIKLKEVMSGVAETGKALCPDAKTIAQKFLQGMGGLHMLATGFLVVGNIMERYETISSNGEECVCLLESMNNLIQDVKKLQEGPGLRKAIEAKIKEAIKLIIEVSLACCTQIDMPKYRRFFSTTVNKKDLQGFQTRLTELHRNIQLLMEFVLYDLLIEFPMCPRPDEEFRRENKGRIEKVTGLLKRKSKKRAVAVILYGLGGTGKTALADAVYWSLCHEKVLQYGKHEEVLECKYSYVRLFAPTTLVEKIPEVQKQILQDLTSRKVDIRRYEEGQVAIGRALEKEVVFLYIDNVLFPDKVEQGLDAIEQLLPRTPDNVKKLRLLITTRDKGAAVKACKKLRIKTELYPIETLEDTKAIQLVKEELNGMDEQLLSKQIYQIVEICGGIPQILKEVAAYIRVSENREEAQKRYHEVIWDRENASNGQVEWNKIARYAFAHEDLDEKLKELFFDICSYFKGWNWEELSNIVGDIELNRLEDRALVTKDVKSMTAKVHIVILAIGVQNKGERYKFTSGIEFQDFLEDKKDEDLCHIKGIWSNDNIGPLDIPSSKLDLMCRSLRVLTLQNSIKVSGRCNGTFEELFFFSAEISHNPFDLSKVKKLRHLRYSPDDFDDLCQMPSNLIRKLQIRKLRIRQLGLCGSIESLPESIGQFNFFESIDLSSTDLKKLPDGFCSLSFLKNLVMDNCWSLEELPDGFGKLGSLRKLSLSGCVSLKKLPETFSQLKLLEDLNLSCCVTLEELCAGFKSLSSLRILLLGTCRMLEKLPQDFHCLTLLEHLCLSDCDKLEGKPMESIVKMETLQTVDIQRSPLLREAWQNIKEDCNQWSQKVGRTSGQGSSTEESMERNDDMQE